MIYFVFLFRCFGKSETCHLFNKVEILLLFILTTLVHGLTPNQVWGDQQMICPHFTQQCASWPASGTVGDKMDWSVMGVLYNQHTVRYLNRLLDRSPCEVNRPSVVTCYGCKLLIALYRHDWTGYQRYNWSDGSGSFTSQPLNQTSYWAVGLISLEPYYGLWLCAFLMIDISAFGLYIIPKNWYF